MRIPSLVLSLVIAAVTAGASDTPWVTSVTPANLVVSAKSQRLSVTGTGFAAGLTAEVQLQGNTETFSGTSIQRSGSTSFTIAVVLAQAGTGSLVVRNTDGGVSEPFPLRVQIGQPQRPSVPSPAVPVLEGVSPERATRRSVPQTVTLHGRNFARGLSVTVTDPTGIVTVLASRAVEVVSPTTVRLSVALNISGDYTCAVTNPATEPSDTITIVVS